MRNRLTRAFCGLAASVAVTTTLGLMGAGAAGAATSHAKPNATPACDFNCFNLYSQKLGDEVIQNAYIPGDNGVGGRVGRKVNMKAASNSHPNQDFSVGFVGTLGQFCNAWPAPQSFSPTSYACLNYPDGWSVFEADWSPFGNESQLCVGVAGVPFDGEWATLQQCGASDNTLWIGDRQNGTGGDCRASDNFCPWINGADTNFSHPLVLSLNTGSHRPTNELSVERLNLLTGGVGQDTQEFAHYFGPVS